jgi:hypothetical protein
LSDNSYSYQYNEQGNREQQNHLMGPGYDTYAWDQRNRLVAFDTPGNSGISLLVGQFGQQVFVRRQNEGRTGTTYRV